MTDPKITRIQNHLKADLEHPRKCSFCEHVRPCVSGTLPGVSDDQHICLHCLQMSGEVLDTQPPASVACLRCQQYLSFTAWYPGLMRVKFEAVDMDRGYTTIYLPTYVHGGTWNADMVPQKIICNDCGYRMPVDLFKRTNYISS